MSKPVYAVSYTTESGDSGVVGYFLKEPNDGHLTAYFQKVMPDEFIDDGEDGPIKRRVFWDVWKLTELKMPKPVEPIESI